MNSQIYEEATNWLLKHREADLGSQEKRVFDMWLRESPQHVRAYLEMSAVWEDVPELDASWNPTSEQLIARARSEGNVHHLADTAPTTVRQPYPQPSSRHLEKRKRLEPLGSLQHSALESDESPSRDKANPSTASNARISGPEGIRLPRSGRMRPFALATTFVIAVAGVTTWYWLNRNTYATDVGEQRSIVLTDGSTMELNSRSRVRIRYTDSQRDVDLLEGQALFKVAHNTARPFVVHSGRTNVRAVGTQFDVYKRHAGTIVTVVEGRVAVLANTFSASQEREPRTAVELGAGGQAPSREISGLPIQPRAAPMLKPFPASKNGGSNAIFLAAGEQLTIPAVEPSRAGSPSGSDNPQPVNVAAATAWTHRALVFESSTLPDVAEEFNRYNTRQLVATDPELANIHITGIFSSVDPALLLKFLHTQAELSIEETDTEIRISKR